MLNLLPTEIICKILDYLPKKDLSNVSVVSKDMFNIATDSKLWQNTIEINSLNEDVFERLQTPRFANILSLSLNMQGEIDKSPLT